MNEPKTTIINGDCLEELKKMPDNSVDCVVTSPPYNLKGIRGGVDLTQLDSRKLLWGRVSVNYDTYDDNLPEPDYIIWQTSILNELHRIIKPTGSIFYNHKHRMWQRKGYHFWTQIIESNVQFYQEITWNRGNTPAIDKRLLFQFTERIEWLCKEKPNVYKSQAKHKSDIWSIKPNSDKNHPASFPLELAENAILLTTQPGDIVLDPFAGSGTTLLAAKQLGRNSIGIEISKKYCELIEQRVL